MTIEEFSEFTRIAGLIADEAGEKITSFAKTIILLKQSLPIAMFLMINSLIMNNEFILFILAFCLYLVLLCNHLAGYFTRWMDNIALLAEAKIVELERNVGNGVKITELENYKQYFRQKS